MLAAPDSGSKYGSDPLAGQTVSLVDVKNSASPENSCRPLLGAAAMYHLSGRLHSWHSPGLLYYFLQWDSYPDVLAMQFNWDGYYKEVGSAFIGSSPEFEFALYSLCFIARPGKV